MDFSVGDFAEQIMAQDAIAGKLGASPSMPTFAPDDSHYSPEISQQAPDISEVVVPDDFISSIVEAKTPQAPEAVAVPTSSPVPSTSTPTNEVAELKSLVNEIKGLLIEVKQTISEMTSVGMGIGAPAAGVSPKKAKKDDDDEDGTDDLAKLLKRIKTRRTK